MDEATISTLHGFAARILADVPLEAGVPPGFEVRDAITSQLENARAWRSFLDRLLADESVADHLLSGLTLDMDPRTKRLRQLALIFAANWDQLAGRPFTARPMPSLDASAIITLSEPEVQALRNAPDGDALTTHLRKEVQPARRSCVRRAIRSMSWKREAGGVVPGLAVPSVLDQQVPLARPRLM